MFPVIENLSRQTLPTHTHWKSFLQLLRLKVFGFFLFRWSRKRVAHFGLCESSLVFERRGDKILLFVRSKFIFLNVGS